ncbi:MFS transporter [Acidaminobacter sp. JC074]|uniref:MFS transporter n=1 Tax=Acidaminobacter sp. JC074 TaxID=2530199 RepID=UPI001F116FB7|nr:MFS transporter [Acidaminobacter sp. JC074]MCH4887536.1 MFS transporter [Acidaminobacter sp. JC074]
MGKNKQMIFGISIGHFFNDLLVSFVPSMMFMLAISHKLTIVQQTLILAFLSFTSSMLQPVISKFVLFLGKKVLIFSVIWIAVFTSAISFTSSFLELFILVGLAGIASSIYHPVGSALTLNLSNKSKGFSLGLFMTVGGVAASFSPLFFAMMTKSGDFRKLLFIVPIGLIVAFIMYALKTDELDFDFINKSSSRANHVEFCTYKWIGVLILLTTIRSVVYKVMLSFGVQVLTYEVISKSHLVFIFLLVSTLGTLIGGYVSDRIPSKLLFVASNFQLC